MSIGPNRSELLARARSDMRLGVPVVIFTEGVFSLVVAAEALNQDRLDLMRSLPSPCLLITRRRAEVIKARVYDGDFARLELPADCDLNWIRGVVMPDAALSNPLQGPYFTQKDAASATYPAALAIAKTSQLLPACLVARVDADYATAHNLVALDATDILQSHADGLSLAPVVSARLPLRVSEAGRLHVFRDSLAGEEHYAVEIGSPDRAQPVLSRLHSACFTGDILGSLKCDCGTQLNQALNQMGAEGAGVLLYLNQEGRGIGLTNKMRAYALQDQGFDTVEANHRLGFEDDERDFRIGTDILKTMGFSAVRLLTNNPRKIQMMESAGLKVTERVPLAVGSNPHNVDYLRTKADKSGHLL